jgi:hypothetical protein
MQQGLKMPENLLVGDTLHVIWVDGYEQTGTYTGTERGYILIKTADGNVNPCFPSHLKEINVDRSQRKTHILKKAKKPNKNS